MRPKPMRRCGCRDPQTGKKYGAKCHRLKGKDHGAWWYRYEAPVDANGRRRQPLIGPFRTKKEAEESLAQQLARTDRHVALDRALTFGEYLDQWLAGKAKLKETTRAAAAEHIALYF